MASLIARGPSPPKRALDQMDISKLKVTELKEELTKLGLPTKGLKVELVERLELALKNGASLEKESEKNQEQADETAEAVENENETPKKRRGRSASIEMSKIPKIEEAQAGNEAEKPVTETPDVIEEPKESSVMSPESSTTETVVSAVPEASTVNAPASNSTIVHVSHLTRPFTVNEFKDLCSTYGKVQDLWFDSLKSQSFVTFDSMASAVKCQKELNGKRFPEQTGKLLVVELSTSAKMENLKKESEGMSSTAIGATLMNTFNNSPENQNIPLEELFKRTTSEPSIYYLPNPQN